MVISKRKYLSMLTSSYNIIFQMTTVSPKMKYEELIIRLSEVLLSESVLPFCWTPHCSLFSENILFLVWPSHMLFHFMKFFPTVLCLVYFWENALFQSDIYRHKDFSIIPSEFQELLLLLFFLIPRFWISPQSITKIAFT